jgi:putative ABC transport system permease protein
VLRAPIRSALLVAVLAVSIGLALTMITVNAAFAERLDDIKGEIGNEVSVVPAGSFGGGGFVGIRIGGPDGDSIETNPTLEEAGLDALADVANVTSITKTITAPYTGDGLESAIEAPEGFERPPIPEGAEGSFSFVAPILVTGTSSTVALKSFGIEDAEITSGRMFTSEDDGANVAILAEDLADKNSLSVGDTFEMEGATIEVIGVFTTGTQFGGNAVFLPLATAQSILDREGEIDQATLTATSVDTVQQVADDVRTALGEDVADVTSDQSTFAGVSAPVSDAKSSAEIGMIVALVVSAAIILFSVFIVMRQRIKEIGIFKAIGASNWNVVSQFGLETTMIAVAAAVIGAAATFPLAQGVADNLVSEPSQTASPVLDAPPGGDVIGIPGDGAASGPITSINSGLDSTFGGVDVGVSADIFLYAIIIAIGLALLASIAPAWYVGRVKPAEVLRYE